MDVETPVLIVGGGGAGLTASLMLSSYGIESWLINASPTTSELPKAHMLNQRTMEIFAELGVADAIYAGGTPAENMRSVCWYAGFAGPHPDYGRRIGKIEAWGDGYHDPDYVAASPRRTANFSQHRLEPVLRARAEELSPGSVSFNHELLSFTHDASGVVAEILNNHRECSYTVRARYMIAADGGRTVGRQLGVRLTGEREPLGRTVTVHMTADLAQWAQDSDAVIRLLINPEIGSSYASGVLLAAGPTRWGPDSEEWHFHMMVMPGDPEVFDEVTVLERLRRTLGLPDLDVTIHSLTHWTVYGVVADRFSCGPTFIVGDAAHRSPPSGGLGLNTAVGDVNNLCWKLAEVLNGHAEQSLLDTYETERRPVAERVVEQAMDNFVGELSIASVHGLSPEQDLEENWARMREVWSADPSTEAKRHAVANVLASQSMDFRDHNLEVGQRYCVGAVVPDGTAEPVPVDELRVYQPSTRPGHPMPHAWISRLGQRLPIRDLVAGGRWLLVTGEEGQPWVEAAEKLAAERDWPLHAFSVGHASGDWHDIRCAWLRQREVSAAGCVLVRPDRYVAWRAADMVSDPFANLADVCTRLLGERGAGADHVAASPKPSLPATLSEQEG